MALLRLLFLAPLAFVAACLAGAGVLVAGILQGIAPLPVGGALYTMVIGAGMGIGAFAALPVLFAAVVAEMMGWRSLFYWLAVGAVLALLAAATPLGIAVMEVIATFVLAVVYLPDMTAYDGSGQTLATIALGAGFAGGFVYWLIAGRLAGSAGVGEEKFHREGAEHSRE